MVLNMLFDPILNSELVEEEEMQFEPGTTNQPLICAHCHRLIKGKYFQSGKNYYDEFCWQFRFVIDELFIERASRNKIKQFDEDGYEI